MGKLTLHSVSHVLSSRANDTVFKAIPLVSIEQHLIASQWYPQTIAMNYLLDQASSNLCQRLCCQWKNWTHTWVEEENCSGSGKPRLLFILHGSITENNPKNITKACVLSTSCTTSHSTKATQSLGSKNYGAPARYQHPNFIVCTWDLAVHLAQSSLKCCQLLSVEPKRSTSFCVNIETHLL